MKIKVKYLDNFKGKEIFKKKEDSGYDLYASIKESICLKSMEIKTIPLGIAIEALGICPNGFNWDVQIRGRSGLNSKGILATVGTIDSGYRGELMTSIINLSGKDFTIEPADRVCQIVIGLAAHCEVKEDNELSLSNRNDKGFGSSGMK